jgi:hypothetical protein
VLEPAADVVADPRVGADDARLEDGVDGAG